MGLPEGWVTAVPGLSRREQLAALGNGVVPQQCALALNLLMPEEVMVFADGPTRVSLLSPISASTGQSLKRRCCFSCPYGMCASRSPGPG